MASLNSSASGDPMREQQSADQNKYLGVLPNERFDSQLGNQWFYKETFYGKVDGLGKSFPTNL